MLMLDIDHFKEVNDTYGHKVGDRVLQALSLTCREILREFDVLGRLGGEEFAVLLPMTDGAAAREIAERLRQAVGRAQVPLERGLPLGFAVSIGVAQMPAREVNIDTLLHLADLALYQAKRNGRNQVSIYREE